MDIEQVGTFLLEAARYLTLVQAIIGMVLLAGLVVWRDEYRAWSRDRERGRRADT